MAVSLPEMMGNWQAVPHLRPSLLSGVAPAALANPNRLAIGFSYRNAATIILKPLTGLDQEFPWLLIAPGTEWFWWQKHGPIVGLAWQAEGLTGLGDFISVIEITQTNTGAAHVS